MAENKMIYMPDGAFTYKLEGRESFMPDGRPTYKDYMFLASKIKARAHKMITFEQLEQVLSSGSVDAAARRLAEFGWPNMMGMSSAEINQVLSERWESLMKEFSMLVPEDQVLELFQIPYDCHNAKTIV
ncbi:MAG: V-type ATPase subunit, partial [Oscillospiraceae bacterium]|nr:V-type ATPase subunit [Oscillospiraceae bacterium]